jgi:hypothetical protein
MDKQVAANLPCRTFSENWISKRT